MNKIKMMIVFNLYQCNLIKTLKSSRIVIILTHKKTCILEKTNEHLVRNNEKQNKILIKLSFNDLKHDITLSQTKYKLSKRKTM